MSKEPKLVELGADTRKPASTKNLDVSGTTGPDYLGQQTVDVDGHPCDRPGVQNRMPENNPNDSRIAQMDTGEELPVLLSSNMRTDPIEGTQGSYTEIVEGECPRCGYDRIRVSVQTMAGERHHSCNACGAQFNTNNSSDYSMPTLPEEWAERAREGGEVILENSVRDLVKTNSHDARLVGDRESTYIPIRMFEKYFWALVDNEDIDLEESVDSNLGELDRMELFFHLLPDNLMIVPEDNDDENNEDEE